MLIFTFLNWDEYFLGHLYCSQKICLVTVWYQKNKRFWKYLACQIPENRIPWASHGMCSDTSRLYKLITVSWGRSNLCEFYHNDMPQTKLLHVIAVICYIPTPLALEPACPTTWDHCYEIVLCCLVGPAWSEGPAAFLAEKQLHHIWRGSALGLARQGSCMGHLLVAWDVTGGRKTNWLVWMPIFQLFPTYCQIFLNFSIDIWCKNI